MTGTQRQIDLNTLQPQQLAGLKEQMDSELDNLMQSLRAIQGISKQYSMSEVAIDSLKDQEPGVCIWFFAAAKPFAPPQPNASKCGLQRNSLC